MCACACVCVYTLRGNPAVEHEPREGLRDGARFFLFLLCNKREKLERDPFSPSVPEDTVFLAQWGEADP